MIDNDGYWFITVRDFNGNHWNEYICKSPMEWRKINDFVIVWAIPISGVEYDEYKGL